MALVKPVTAEIANTPFAEGSAWDDQIWRFPVTTAGTGKAVFSMNWAIPLPDGGVLTDPAYAAILEAWKRVLWTMIVAPPDGHPRKGSYCGRFGTALRFLLPWMLATGRRDLASLDNSAFDDFLEAISAKAAEDNEDDNEAAWGDGGITDVAVSSYLVIFALPYVVRAELAAAGFPAPNDDPLGGRTPIGIAREICSKITRQTPEVPDAIFVATVNAALTMLEELWLEPLIELCESLATNPNSGHESQCRTYLDTYFRDVAGREASTQFVKAIVIQVRASCQILIQAASAVRISELCGIQTKGRNSSTGLPKCVKMDRTFDDEYELFSLDAQLFKHTSSSEPAAWVLGMRPVGSTYLPPPVKAIDILHRLDDRWRKVAGIDQLLVQFSKSWGFPTDRRPIAPASGTIIRRHQRSWLTEVAGVKEEERVTTHMWRKTFARYLIRVSADLLPAISHHLKHLSIAMTEVGYCKPDPATRQLIEDARVEEAGSVIFGAITGRKRVEGPIAKEIRELGNELSRRLGNRPADSMPRDIEQEVRERRIELYGNEVGWCVFRSESARCHLLMSDPAPAFLRLAPAFQERRADVCQKCANFGIGDEHLAFWQERRSSLRERLAACEANTPPSIIANLQRSIGRCDTVLSWMNAGADNA